MKPMLKYRGGKSSELTEIKKFIPQYTGKYIEPFLGGGALYFNLEPKSAIINDINQELIGFYNGIKNNFEQVKFELSEIQNIYDKNRKEFEMLKEQSNGERVTDANESLYYEFRDIFNKKRSSNLNPATVYYFINKTAYSGMIRYNKNGEFNVPYGRYKNFNTDIIRKEHSILLKNTQIYSYDYSKIFDMANKDDFIFLDPPYDCVFSDYGNIETKDGFTEDMHRKLASDYKSLKSKALLVISKTPLIQELYGDYIIYEYDKKYSVNIRNRFKSEAKHVIITNYEVKSSGKFNEEQISLFHDIS